MQTRQPKILWVDDDLDEGLASEIELRQVPVEISYSSTATDAKRKLAAQIFDLIILDLIFPDDIGLGDPYGGFLSVLNCLTSQYAKHADLPKIVVLTAAPYRAHKTLEDIGLPDCYVLDKSGPLMDTFRAIVEILNLARSPE